MMLYPSGLLPLRSVECAWVHPESDPESESVPKTIPMRDYREDE
jgi:hypothetical protein